MFLGLSLTTWMIILGAFVTITPIAGKQVAKDSLRVKDDLKKNIFVARALFPMNTDDGREVVLNDCPVQYWSEETYTKLMMAGGVWWKFLLNFAVTIIIAAWCIIFPILVFGSAPFRNIFSRK
jgi:hypothetical protein